MKDLVKSLSIPTIVRGMTAADIKPIAIRAINEAHGDTFSAFTSPIKYILDTGYPVPKYMTDPKRVPNDR